MALTALNLLSARKVETAQPRPKVYQLRDGGSLFCAFSPTAPSSGGTATGWAALNRCTQSGCKRSMLEAARAERDRAKALVKKGLDPIVEKRRRSPSRPTHTNARSRPLLGSGSSAMLTGASTTPTRSPATLRRDVFPGLASCRSASSGSTSAPHHQGCGRPVARRLWAILIRQWWGTFAWLPKVSCEYDPAACSRDWPLPQVRHNPPLTWAEIPTFQCGQRRLPDDSPPR